MSHVTVLGTEQSKRHIGFGLFCTKKPPKVDNPDNGLTHHQRKHRKLVRQHLFRNPHQTVYGLMVSKDDKAYIKPGTSAK